MQKILVAPEDVWGYFEENMRDLEESMLEIAENAEYGVTVFLMNDHGFPGIVVEADGTMAYGDFVTTPKDCADTVSEIYENFLSSKAVENLSNVDTPTDEDEQYSLFDLEDEIEMRELEIEDALWAFLDSVTNTCASLEMIDTDAEFEDIKEHFLEYLGRVHGLPVHRPMFLTDEDGTEFFEEYPYEYMIFDDDPVSKA